MKRCSRCKQEKPIEEFGKMKATKDGLYSHCRICERLRQQDKRLRYGDRLRLFALKYRNSNPKRVKSYNKKYYAENKQKVYARLAVQKALKDGFLFKKPCSRCGSLNVQAHHPDYNKPLEVIWFCVVHHRQFHFGF